jgi:hypothetical protein
MGRFFHLKHAEGLALNRDQGSYTIHIGIKDLNFGTSTPSRPTWHSVKASRSQRAQCPIVGTELGVLLTAKAKDRVGLRGSNLL